MRFLLLYFIVSLLVCVDAYSMDLNDFMSVDYVEFSEDWHVMSDGGLDVGSIDIVDAISIINDGIVRTNEIYIENGSHVYIKNRGTFSADYVYMSENARIVQVVSDVRDMNKLDIPVGFDLLVSDAHRMSLVDVMNFAADADKITLNNSSFVVWGNHMELPNFSEIELSGEIIFYLYGYDFGSGNPLLHNVSEYGSVSVWADNVDPIFAVRAYVSDDDLYVGLVRETDYKKILGDETGDFLNDMRRRNMGDKLLSALDGANSFSELRAIMARSARLNPILMMRPVRMFNKFETLSDYHLHDDMDAGIFYVGADDFYISGIRIGGAVHVDDSVSVWVSGYGGILNYADDMDEYMGLIYGANAKVVYDCDVLFVRSVAGLSAVRFDTEPVFDGTGATTSPDGVSVYVSADVGHGFDITSDITISPYVGLAVDDARILHQNDSEILAHAGADLSYGFDMLGIRYDYIVSGRVATNGDIIGGVRANFWSVMDGAGAGIGANILHDDIFGISYKFSITGNMRF